MKLPALSEREQTQFLLFPFELVRYSQHLADLRRCDWLKKELFLIVDDEFKTNSDIFDLKIYDILTK